MAVKDGENVKDVKGSPPLGRPPCLHDLLVPGATLCYPLRHVAPVPMPAGPALLVVGHPGHELRVHGWLEHNRPLVMVLTDGSGHSGTPRLASTEKLLRSAGARAGEIFGQLTDSALYRALLDRRSGVFTSMAEGIADTIVKHDIQVVVGDDAEGFNPTHDVCRLVLDAAVRMARTRSSRSITNLAFALMETPDAAHRGEEVWSSTIVLSDDALERKLRAALDYPEMAAEVAAARARWHDEAFRFETFRHVSADEVWAPADEQPFYEKYGAGRVKDGAYAEVIQYDRHMLPVIAALAASTLRQAS